MTTETKSSLNQLLEEIPADMRRKIKTSAKEIKELLEIGCTPDEIINWANMEARKRG